MHALQVAAENKHLIGLQLRYHVRGIIRTLYSIVQADTRFFAIAAGGTAFWAQILAAFAPELRSGADFLQSRLFREGAVQVGGVSGSGGWGERRRSVGALVQVSFGVGSLRR